VAHMLHTLSLADALRLRWPDLVVRTVVSVNNGLVWLDGPSEAAVRRHLDEVLASSSRSVFIERELRTRTVATTLVEARAAGLALHHWRDQVRTDGTPISRWLQATVCAEYPVEGQNPQSLDAERDVFDLLDLARLPESMDGVTLTYLLLCAAEQIAPSTGKVPGTATYDPPARNG
jgi:hypothetical protein